MFRTYVVAQKAETRELLTDLEIGDQKRSQLLREMQLKGGTKVQENVLRTLRSQRLPGNIQGILSISGIPDFVRLSEMSDRIIEIC